MNDKILKIHRILLLILVTAISNKIEAQIDLYADLSPGQYKVGFRQVEINNDTDNHPRKIKISYWYPSKRSDSKALTIEDYLNRMDETNSVLMEKLSDKIAGKGLFPSDTLQMILNTSLLAKPNAPELTEKFPLLMWGARNETVEYQFLISEYLASNGYVVAYVENIPTGPYPWLLPTAEEKESFLNQQLATIDRAFAYLWQQKNVDPTKNAMITWSYAGESAILSQIKNPAIKAVVGLSALGFSTGVFLGTKLKNRIHLTKLNVPYLVLFEKKAPNGSIRVIPDIFSSMHPDSRYISFPQLAHGNFNVIEGMIPGVLGTNKAQSWSRGGESAKTGYEIICQTTLLFLDAVLNNGAKFDDALDSKIEIRSEFLMVSKPTQ